MSQNRQIRTIADQAYSILRDNICSGLYEPGYWLQEAEVCSQLGVSRSPVREAMLRLAADGLLISIPNKGTFVKKFTCKDIDEIFDMRVLLESYGIRGSRTALTSGNTSLLLNILDDLEREFAAGDLESYTKADETLHKAIVALGGNSIVNATYDRVGSMNQQFRILSLSVHRRFDESIDEHRTIIHSIIQGNTKQAEAVNCRHLELARRCIKEQLEQRANEEAAKPAENPEK